MVLKIEQRYKKKVKTLKVLPIHVVAQLTLKLC